MSNYNPASRWVDVIIPLVLAGAISFVIIMLTILAFLLAISVAATFWGLLTALAWYLLFLGGLVGLAPTFWGSAAIGLILGCIFIFFMPSVRIKK